jgi:hypothetical protein
MIRNPIAAVVSGVLWLAATCCFAAEDSSPSLPPIQTAVSDAKGRITVNGEPFFPILMYDVPTDAESLKMFREHGFNTLSAKPEDADRLREHGFYVAAHAGKKVENLGGVLLGVGMDSPALYWKEDLIEKAKADLERMRGLVPNRPIMNAIGYWEDEPPGVKEGKVPRKERYEDLVKVLDVSAPYLYPLPYQPVRSLAEAMARANAATGGAKPLLPVLQLFVWEPGDRYPTPAELRCMVYLALIHGADGIGYYSYKYVTGKKDTNIAREQPELWRAVSRINAEVAAIGRLLGEAQPDGSASLKAEERDVELRAFKTGHAQLILLANPTDGARKVTLRLGADAKGTLRSLDGQTKLDLEKGEATIALEPFGATAMRHWLKEN